MTTRPTTRNRSIVKSVSLALMFGAASAGIALAQSAVRVLAPASGSGTALVALAEAYSKTHPDVDVKIQQFPSGDPYAQALLTQLQAGAGADLIYTNGGWGAPESLMPLAKAQRLGDLSGTKFGTTFNQQLVPDFWLDNKLYGLPLALLNVGLVYNAAEFKTLGITPPDTFDDLLKICAKAQENGRSAIGLAGAAPFYFLETLAVSTLYNHQPDWNSQREQGKVTFAGSDGWKDAFARVQKMIDDKCFVPGIAAVTPPQMFTQLASAQALMAVGPTTLMGAVKEMNPDLDLRMAPFPSEKKEDTVAIGFYNDALSLNAASANKEASLAFLEWLAEPAQQEVYAKVAGGTTPPDAQAAHFQPMLADMEPFFKDNRVRSVPHHTWIKPQVRAALTASGNAFLAGQKSGNDVLVDLDNAWH